MKKVIIIGAGGHSKVIADIVRKCGDEVVGFLDDNTELPETVGGMKNLGCVSNIEKYKGDCCFFVGIGNNRVRKLIDEKYDAEWYTAVHPSAVIAADAEIGEGTAVMANAVVNPSAKVGRHCIINTGAVIEHDNRLGNYVHVSPNGTLCGTVTVGECTHIGAGAVVKNNISICENVVIGAGAAAVKNITEQGTYVGVPAKRLK